MHDGMKRGKGCAGSGSRWSSALVYSRDLFQTKLVVGVVKRKIEGLQIRCDGHIAFNYGG